MTDRSDDTVELAALIGSRICHDLVSPVGAITNGVELLGMTANGAFGPELDLIAESAVNATARLQFFRVAFGTAGTEPLASENLRTLMSDFFGEARLQIKWHATGDHARSDIQLVLLAIMCCETALPFGGQITVDFKDPLWSVTCTSDSLRLEDTLWSHLRHGNAPTDLPAAQVQFALLPLHLERQARALDMALAGDSLTIRF